jgi:DNA-binding transcriptional regulator PaaX
MGDLLYAFLTSARSTKLYRQKLQARAKEAYRRRLAAERLISRGYVTRVGDRLSIRKAGLRILERTIEDTKKTLGRKHWDGKWRIVAFDIPEKQRHLRSEMRSVLKRTGFIQLQKSIWVFPHDCEELAVLLKEEVQLKECVLYGVLEKIDNDSSLRKKFSFSPKI